MIQWLIKGTPFKLSQPVDNGVATHKKVIFGIGIVTCVYVNPEEDAFWVLDYRIYDPERDGKTKIEHLLEMLRNCHYQKKLPIGTVLMDTW